MTIKQIEASSGAGWARSAVAVGAVLSVAGNATETVLTTSAVNLAIRITIAVALPVLVFIAVEVFVRVAWRRTVLDFTGRAMLLVLPAFGAAYVSFGHLFRLARLSGADGVAASANALAIDGLMIGGTVALLAIRAARLAELAKDDLDVNSLALRALSGQGRSQSAPVRESDARPVLVHGGSGEAGTEPVAVAGGQAPSQPMIRKHRAPRAEQEKAVRMLLEGNDRPAVIDATGMGDSTLRRYERVIRMVRAGKVDIDPDREKVSQRLIDMMREHTS